MYALGHVGIGTRLVPPGFRARFSWRWLALGCLLPDLIDKPLFLGAMLAGRIIPGHLPARVALLRHSRLVGHSLFLLLALIVAAWALRSVRLRALALAVPTHLLLDVFPDLASGYRPGWPRWLLWPLFRWRLPDPPNGGHEVASESALYLAGELIGAALLVWEYVRYRRARG